MTLRQEIEKLISDLTKMHIERRDHPNDYVRGRGDGIEMAVDNLTDILSRHTEPEPTAPFNPQDELKAIQEWIKGNPEEHEKILDEINAQPNIGPTAQEMFAMMRCDHTQSTAPSQRERIATAVFVSILSEKDKAIHIPTAASSSVYSADALIEELNKKTK